MTDISATVVRDRASPIGRDYDDGLAVVKTADDPLQRIPGRSLIAALFARETPDQNAEHATHCINCGGPLQARRSTRAYCSDRCQKASKRSEARVLERRIFDRLTERGFIGQVWPVYRGDTSPRVLGLMVPRAAALAEITVTAPETTDADLVRSLRCFHVMEGNVEADLIRHCARRRASEDCD